MKRLIAGLVVGLAAAVPALAGGSCEMGSGGMSCPAGSTATPALLIAIALGYWVLTLARNQQKPLDLIGKILGTIITLGALLSLICFAVCAKKACAMKSGGAMACHAPMAGDTEAAK